MKCKFFIRDSLDQILGVDKNTVGRCRSPNMERICGGGAILVYKDSVCGLFHNDEIRSFPCNEEWIK